MTVKIYSARWCPYCQMAKRFLAEKGVEYSEVNIEELGMSRKDLQKMTGGTTVPQIIIDDKSIGGYDNLMALVQSGELSLD
ncbi:MAG: glutaredoxin [Candidatus Marinimicrobia bacterium]|nr:glutaredoxin [Candidatus Neomarinimicrobiota bacterium]MDP6568805.1 glutaredoxin [Candidatus Neomarinimicrobiota bacterium]MDP7025445.1 glutaredoxin [Candidatus Neomarinimicrobiota bacterium]|tara:strand:+ start:79 stop:321 length:243 start_codon:yes stop_codon:yes gene_type:complete